MNYIDYNHLIIISIPIIILILGVFYYRKLKSTAYSSKVTNETIEELLLNISSTLNNIERQISNLQARSQTTKDAGDINMTETHQYMFQLAEAELDKSSLLLDKLNTMIREGAIDERELTKLLTIDTQIKTINRTLSNTFKK